MEFRKITFENFRECRRLSAGKNSDAFVAPNAISLAHAYIAIMNNASDPMPFGIYKGEVMVGFIMMSYIREDQDEELNENIYDVWRFMIDEKYQGRGYGKEALLKAIDFLKTKPKGPAESCFLSYAPGNEKAEGLYRDVGFEATGIVVEGEIEMKLSL